MMVIFFSDWNSNPVLTTLETSDYPVENLTFPSVTICREDNEPNCLEFAAKILDHVPFPCFENRYLKIAENFIFIRLATLYRDSNDLQH